MIKSLLQTSLSNDVKYRNLGENNVPSNEYLIQTALISTNTSEVIFDVTGLGTQFRHLKVATVVKGSGGLDGYNMQFNGDTGSNYAAHVLYGTGSNVIAAAATSASFFSIGLAADSGEAGVFSASECDILDAFHSNKSKVAKVLVFARGNSSPFIQLRTGGWFNTAPLASIRVYPNSGFITAGSRISLYGVTA